MSILKEIWHRIVVSYRSTLIGLACGIGVLACQVFVDALKGDAAPWAQALAGLLVILGAALKDKAAPPVGP